MVKIFTLVLVVLSANATAQTKLFGKYHFEQGGYTVVGLLSEKRQNLLQEQLGSFYTNDIAVLNEFKKTWVFAKKVPVNTCGYHYSIQLTQKGTIKEDWLINLDCKVISTDKGYFFFDPEKLFRLAVYFKKPVLREDVFISNAEGRHFIDSVKKDTGLLLSFEPFWTKYEGTFTINSQKVKKESKAVLEKRLQTSIRKQYPKEKFLIFPASGDNADTYVFQFISNKSLFDKLTGYSRNSWKAYEPKLTTAWKPSKII